MGEPMSMTEPTPNLLDDETEMPLLDHLRELRDRLFKAAIAVAVGTGITFAFTEQILSFILTPLCNGKPLNECRLLVTSPTESLTNVFTISMTVGMALALPVVLYQIIAFILPGLLPKERRWLQFGLPVALVMFVVGAGFAWYLFIPSALGFLTGILPSVFQYQIKPDEYIPFVMGVLFWMGVVFELPIIVFLLAKLNVVNARVLTKGWRYAVVGIAIIAAFVTPTPDPFNMLLVMSPLLVLYVIGIGLAWLARRGATVPALLDPEEKVKMQPDKTE